MSIDHVPMLFIGLNETQVDMAKLPDFDVGAYGRCEDKTAYLKKYGVEKGVLGLTLQCQNMDCSNIYVGFILAEGESWGYEEFPMSHIKAKIDIFGGKFLRLFGTEPKVIVMDYIF